MASRTSLGTRCICTTSWIRSSVSSSRRCLSTSADSSGPSAISSAAALRRPERLSRSIPPPPDDSRAFLDDPVFDQLGNGFGSALRQGKHLVFEQATPLLRLVEPLLHLADPLFLRR